MTKEGDARVTRSFAAGGGLMSGGGPEGGCKIHNALLSWGW
jgi:hypothetical protein